MIGIWLNLAEFKSAARPVSAPTETKAPSFIRPVSIPASRAASVFDPVAYNARTTAMLRDAHSKPIISSIAIAAVTIGYVRCENPNH